MFADLIVQVNDCRSNYLFEKPINAFHNWYDDMFDYWLHKPLAKVVYDLIRKDVNSYDKIPECPNEPCT